MCCENFSHLRLPREIKQFMQKNFKKKFIQGYCEIVYHQHHIFFYQSDGLTIFFDDEHSHSYSFNNILWLHRVCDPVLCQVNSHLWFFGWFSFIVIPLVHLPPFPSITCLWHLIKCPLSLLTSSQNWLLFIFPANFSQKQIREKNVMTLFTLVLWESWNF